MGGVKLNHYICEIKPNNYKQVIMKTIKNFALLVSVCVAVLMAAGCDKTDDAGNTSGTTDPIEEPKPVENPLTDLPWLKAKVDEITLIIKNGNPLSVSIYQCVYGDSETGFLIDEGNIKPFYNCKGEVLCIMGGVAGETCPELNIIKQKLIREIKIEEPKPVEKSIVGEWKLNGIVDAETGKLTELEPKDCKKCYTLTFTEDYTYTGFSSTNALAGKYTVNFEASIIEIQYGGTKMGEFGDGALYADILSSVQSFSFSETGELKLYSNEKKNYLLYKRNLTETHETTGVLMLKVDFTTNTFEGGYEHTFNKSAAETFTISSQYQSPGDFGGIELYFSEIDKLLFSGTIFWMGLGEIQYPAPDKWLSAEDFDKTGYLYYISPKNGFEEVLNYEGGGYFQYLNETEIAAIWGAVQPLVKAREYIQENPEQKVKMYLYTPTVGLTDWAVAKWVIFLKK